MFVSTVRILLISVHTPYGVYTIVTDTNDMLVTVLYEVGLQDRVV